MAQVTNPRCRLTNMGLKSRDGVDLRDYWKDGIRAYLGMTTAGFPNAFMTYTPYAPTALSNGTTIIEAQSDFAANAIRKILASEQGGARRIKSVEALPGAEDEWAAYVEEQNAPTLFPLTESWWTGANIPGKKAQMLTYLNGLERYEQEVQERLGRWEGFAVRYADGELEARDPPAAQAGVPLRPKGDEVSTAEHVEHASGQGVKGSSEAAQVLRPIVAT